MGDVMVSHTRHRDTIPVQLSRPCDERIVVFPTVNSEDRDLTGALVHINLLPDDAKISKIRVE